VYFYVYFIDLPDDGRAGPKTARYVINESYMCIYQKHLERFEMWCWRRMEKISWTHHVRNENVLLKGQGAEEYPT
jgi:hypothetical protein